MPKQNLETARSPSPGIQAPISDQEQSPLTPILNSRLRETTILPSRGQEKGGEGSHDAEVVNRTYRKERGSRYRESSRRKGKGFSRNGRGRQDAVVASHLSQDGRSMAQKAGSGIEVGLK